MYNCFKFWFFADTPEGSESMDQDESVEDMSEVELSGDEDGEELANRIRDRSGKLWL